MTVPTGVFVTSITDALFHFHFTRCELDTSKIVYNNLDQFVASDHPNKVACFQMPFPFKDDFYQYIDNLYDHCDRIIILCSELHGRTVEFIKKMDREKISYFICGALNFKMQHSPVYAWHDWFITSKHFYRYVKPQVLDQLQPYAIKSRAFDILLGTRKSHRDQAYNYILTQGLKDQVVMTYFKSPSVVQKFDSIDSDEWIWPGDYTTEKNKDTNWTVTIVDYHGYRMSLSQIIPIDIYNQTAYTLVAETNTENDWCFFTEKIVKPIIARRLFIVLGNQYYLKNLQKLGFKTFDSVIDESYDNIELSSQRAGAALMQLNWLSQQPQAEVLEKIKPIVEHNYNLMMSTNWYDRYFKPSFVSYF